MAKLRATFLTSSKLIWSVVLLLAALNAALLSQLAGRDTAGADRTAKLEPAPPAPIKPPPPAMIEPPAVEAVLRSGTLIVISKKSQNMFVFSDGMLWASTPISTGKRRHETPSGVFPALR
jgi:L,D-transpeptidase catalytic domain